MWDLAVREEDYTAADSLLRRKFGPDRLPLMHRALLAIVRSDSAALTRLIGETKAQATGYPFAPEAIARYLNDMPRAEAFAQAALASPRSRALRDSVHQVVALLAVAQGRWKDAKSEFARDYPAMPSARWVYALNATWPFLSVPDSELAGLRRELDRWDPGADVPEPNPGLGSVLRPQVRLYLLGLLSSRLGDDARAMRHAAELERAGGPKEAATLVRDLALTVRADVALGRGNPAEALKLLEPVRGEVPRELLVVPFFSEEGSRYLKAELLYRLGRDQEALRWFSNSLQGGPSELAFMAPAQLRQAELYERLGDRKRAADHYSRFIHLWQNCDPQLRPRVEEARGRLAGLVGEPR
jgi:tetratricopeptide (TPR) repeat protein